MPGGFCRISGPRRRARRVDGRRRPVGRCLGARRQAGRDGHAAADRTRRSRIRRLMGNLPSRAADNLFWLGRYLERAEATLRLIRCLAGRMINTDAETGNHGLGRSPRLVGLLVAWHAAPTKAAADPMAFCSRSRCIAKKTTARPCRSCATRAAPLPSFANGFRPTPGG